MSRTDPHAVTVSLTAHDVAPTTAPGQLTVFPPVRRLLRAAVVMLVAMLAAASLIPIPIVHLVGIPLALLVGVLIAFRTARTVSRLAPTHLPCPKCGARNNVGGGLGYRTTTGPVERACESCRRVLELTFEQPAA